MDAIVTLSRTDGAIFASNDAAQMERPLITASRDHHSQDSHFNTKKKKKKKKLEGQLHQNRNQKARAKIGVARTTHSITPTAQIHANQI